MAQDSNKMHSSSKQPKNLKDAPMPPMPFDKQSEEEKEASYAEEIRRIATQSGPLTVDEALKLIEDLEKKGEILKQQADNLFEQRGITPQYLHSYVTNPSNFSSEEWENLQQQRQAFVDSLNIPPDLVKTASATLGSIPSYVSGKEAQEFKALQESQEAKKSSQGRRKQGSALRRGWLPLR